ncbi:MAG: 50S ribosomal protein L13 [Actinomycetota bacterium]
MKTYMTKPSEVTREWWLVDAKDVPLGRLASQVAKLLRGKHKTIFTPHIDTGDFVIVINAEKVKLTGKKSEKKIYYHHTGYIGGLKATDYGTLLKEKPTFVIKEAVRRMLPHNRLGRAMFKKLKVYPGPDHPHHAQKPKPIRLSL